MKDLPAHTPGHVSHHQTVSASAHVGLVVPVSSHKRVTFRGEGGHFYGRVARLAMRQGLLHLSSPGHVSHHQSIAGWGGEGRDVSWGPTPLHPTPCTLHPAPCTPTPHFLHPTPCTLHPYGRTNTILVRPRGLVRSSGIPSQRSNVPSRKQSLDAARR